MLACVRTRVGMWKCKFMCRPKCWNVALKTSNFENRLSIELLENVVMDEAYAAAATGVGSSACANAYDQFLQVLHQTISLGVSDMCIEEKKEG